MPTCGLCTLNGTTPRCESNIECPTCHNRLCDNCLFSLMSSNMGRLKTLYSTDVLSSSQHQTLSDARFLEEVMEQTALHTVVLCCFCNEELDAEGRWRGFRLSKRLLKGFYRNVIANCCRNNVELKKRLLRTLRKSCDKSEQNLATCQKLNRLHERYQHLQRHNKELRTELLYASVRIRKQAKKLKRLCEKLANRV